MRFFARGISPIPLMEVLGVPKEYVDPLKESTASHVAIGYAGYKVRHDLNLLVTFSRTDSIHLSGLNDFPYSSSLLCDM